ncbi:MAG TPA: APC family permease [Candidatus Binatia bacterium]|jgi:APA family basic amino acid/polyamine antiporter|nr:APC family permease [Candidatus Binatia bacterium]
MANAQPTNSGGGDKPATTKATLGLTGLTVNAMALIAPGAFLWLTFQMQSLYGAPMAGCAMWFGILGALLLCFATAISYAELSKLFPGAGSSYLYAEQAFLSKTKAYKFARIAKFFTGWASHLYYWVYPGCMVGVTAILGGYLCSQFWPNTFSGTYNSPLFMWLFCIVFAVGVGYIAFRGVNGSTGVNVAINIIQISALIVFSIIAIAYRSSHPEGASAIHLSGGTAITYNVDQVNVMDDKGKPVQDTWADNSPKTDDKGQPVIKQQDRTVAKDDLDKTKNTDAAVLGALTAMGLGEGDPYPAWQKGDGGKLKVDKDGHAIADPFTISYKDAFTGKGDAKDPLTFNNHSSAISVVAPHGFSFMFIQACIAILILVGFESVTAMGEEAKNARRDIPRAVLLSLVIQGAICYLFEYFAANYLLNSGYTMSNAGASGAPLGDMMLITGTWLFGSAAAGKAFMLIQAGTVFLALIGTTLSCINTGARVTYAMGRDEEVPSHFGLVHGRTLSPHRAIWTLVVISIIIGIISVTVYLGGQSSDLAALDKHNPWYSIGIFSPHAYTWLPNTLLIITLISNFGTFLLYMTTCVIAIVAFKEHHSFNGFKHFFVPLFGLVANFVCMLFYLVGPFFVPGMSKKEPYIALLVAAAWGIYGLIYFKKRSAQVGKPVYLSEKPALG